MPKNRMLEVNEKKSSLEDDGPGGLNSFAFVSHGRFVSTKVRRGQCFRIQFEFPQICPSQFNGAFFWNNLIKIVVSSTGANALLMRIDGTFQSRSTFSVMGSHAPRNKTQYSSNWPHQTEQQDLFHDCNCRIICGTEPTRFLVCGGRRTCGMLFSYGSFPTILNPGSLCLQVEANQTRTVFNG